MRTGNACIAGTGEGCKPVPRSILIFWGIKNIHTEFHAKIIKCKVLPTSGTNTTYYYYTHV